jgi:uncharacterized membrane protein required for colicin V production
MLTDMGVSPEISTYLSIFLIFIICVLIAKLIARFIKSTILTGLTDRITGAVLGLMEGIVVLGLILMLLGSVDLPDKEVRKSSKFYKYVTEATVSIYNFLAGVVGSDLDLMEEVERTIKLIQENIDDR